MSLSLRAQLLGAIAAGFTLGGCKTEAPPAAPNPPDGEATTTLQPSAPSPGSAGAVTSAVPEPAPSASVADVPPSGPMDCNAPRVRRAHTLAVGEKPPKQIPNAKIDFEANGCAAAHHVSDGCTGIRVLAGPERKGAQCVYDVCQGQAAPCGRLLLDDGGHARVAPLRAGVRGGAGWSAAACGEPMPAGARAGWLEDARLEHASVAAFARFSLELLSLGAPSSLVADAHGAALDEIEHARLCFALASEPGAEQGPGPLAMDGLPVRRLVVDVVRAAVEECCCGETFAALVAQWALADCVHPGARAALERIAVDEARHAELGWRFVAWAVAHFGVSARTAASEGLAAGLVRLEHVTASAAPGLEAYGRLSPVNLGAVATSAAALIRQLDRSLDLHAS